MTMASQPAQDGPVIRELDGAVPHAGSRWMRPFEVIAAALLVMIAMILANVASRYVLSTPIIWADEVASMSFLWLAMIGAALAIDRNDHLRLAILCNCSPTVFVRSWARWRCSSSPSFSS
jgi:TRAP-type C4-dicarboxylate transport system permease small subunit